MTLRIEPAGTSAEPQRGAPVVLRARNLSQRFAGKLALDDVSFDVHASEIFGLIGPNGAGKTTTLRILVTLLSPDQGSLEICGMDALALPELVRPKLGYVADLLPVHPRLTVREQLEFFAAAYATQDDPRATASDALELLRLADLADLAVEGLSRGQLQRLHLARALLHDPEVLVLDEPASHLDPHERANLRELLVELRNLGKTIILSSHVLSELGDICTSLGILHAGRLVAAGPIAELSRRRRFWDVGATAEPEGADASAPEHRLRLRTLEVEPRLEDLLRAEPRVTHVERVERDAYVGYHGDETFVAELVAHLVSQGVKLVAVDSAPREIERLFFHYTQSEQSSASNTEPSAPITSATQSTTVSPEPEPSVKGAPE